MSVTHLVNLEKGLACWHHLAKNVISTHSFVDNPGILQPNSVSSCSTSRRCE